MQTSYCHINTMAPYSFKAWRCNSLHKLEEFLKATSLVIRAFSTILHAHERSLGKYFMPKNRHSNAADKILNIFFSRGQKLFMASAEKNTCSSDIPMNFRDVAAVFPYTWHEMLYKHVRDISPSLPPRQNRLKTSRFQPNSHVLFFPTRVMFTPVCLLLCLLPSPSAPVPSLNQEIWPLTLQLNAITLLSIVWLVMAPKKHCSLICSP